MNELFDILLVEDNPQDAELAIHALKRRGLADHLIHVIDGQMALDFLFGVGDYADRDPQEQPKVLLLDLKLPKVDGIEVLRRLRSDERTKALPIVVLTSSREDCDVAETYRLGANSYIVKPVEFEHFAETLGRVGEYWISVNVAPIRSASEVP